MLLLTYLQNYATNFEIIYIWWGVGITPKVEE
jgi:hypothetical protein